MDYLTLAACLWVAIFFLLGFIRGFWKALSALLSLLGAYWAAAYFAPQLAQFFISTFAEANLGKTITWIASATLIFIFAGLFIRLIILMVSRSLPITNRALDSFTGAVLSGAYGVAMAVMMVWGISLLVETYQAKHNDKEMLVDSADPEKETPAVVAFSRRIVSQMVGWNVRQSGGSDELANVAVAYAEQPKVVLDSLHNTVQSDAFKQVVNSPDVKQWIRNEDAKTLSQSPEFKHLVDQPAVQKLRKVIAPNKKISDEALAQQMVEIWSKVDQLKNNPDVSALINDEEVHSFLQGDGKVTASLLGKGQALLLALNTESESPVDVKSKPAKLYQWWDESGQLQISEYADIPQEKQDQASLIPQ